MSSQILHNSTPLTSRSVKTPSTDCLYENVSTIDETDADQALYENLSHYHRHANNHQIIYDVPKSNQFIYAQPKSNAAVNVDSLIPEAARLLLAQNNCKNENDFAEEEECDEEEDPDFDVGIGSVTNSNGEYSNDDYELFTADDEFRDASFNDYGLEVIQEETESQMSSSDTDSEHELDRCVEFTSETLRQRRPNGDGFESNHHLSPSPDEILDLDFSTSTVGMNSEQQEHTSHEEIISTHIKIPSDWDPKPMLARLHVMCEPKPTQVVGETVEYMSGHMQILSGNRKKGTFWNAWKRKFCVLRTGKLIAYDKENCQDVFQEIHLTQNSGKVDVLDPVEFVGVEKGKSMINKIIGVDDGQGHYFVFQCGSTGEAAKWAETINNAWGSTGSYITPVLPKNPSIFRDIVLIDIGSTNIRAGILTHQPTLPAKFFSAVMSENEETGALIYGNDVYLPENRKKAKIRFPFESSSKLCQNTLDIFAVRGFFKKIFSDLNINVENYRVIVTLPRIVDSNCRKNILQMLFDEFCARSVMLYHQSLAAYFAHSVENGIICDVGERCDIIPVSTGFVLSNGWSRAPLGGGPLRHLLRQGLGPQENGLYLSTPAENLVLRFIAENFICVNGGGGRRPSQDSQVVVEMDLRDVLPFSNLIGVNREVLRGVTEGFFDPNCYGLDCDGLQKLLLNSILACGVDIRKEVSQNIFLSGGCSLIPGFSERLEFELTKICPPHIKPKIRSSPYRYHASFIGASVLASTDAYEKSLIQKANYDNGPGPGHWFRFS